jgi:hypothetical protein
VSKPALIAAVLVFIGAGVFAYTARTDAFALIAWFSIAVLTTGAIGVIYGFDQTVRALRARRRRNPS